ncbi:MAG: SCO family protein [Bacteroidota bacterium]|mgnify:FL=1
MRKITFIEKSLWTTVLLVILGVTFLGVWNKINETEKAKRTTPAFRLQIKDFSLINQYGVKISKNNLRGKIIIADFIFTSCAGQCPLMSTKMLELYQMFQYEKDVHFISVSVDPETDTPEIFKKYAEGYGVSAGQQKEDSTKWQFVTGERKEIVRLTREDFKLAFEDNADNAEEYIMHSAKFVLLNEQTEIIGYYDYDDEAKMKELYFTIRAIIDAKK